MKANLSRVVNMNTIETALVGMLNRNPTSIQTKV